MSSAGNQQLTLRNIYLAQFRNHSLELLWLGYQRLKPKQFEKEDEDVITGELKKEMINVLEDPKAPPWVEHYSVAEQVRKNIKKLTGKGRPLIDIEIEGIRRGKRPRLPFEAKRLGRGSYVGDYTGSEGLGAFLDGTYPTTHGDAGMLGYIQEDTETEWTKKISMDIQKKAKKLRIDPKGAWTVIPSKQPPSGVYQTIHTDKNKNPLHIIHFLLLFH